MRWLAATILLLAATVALSGVIYARDLQPGAWRPPAGEAAASDAQAIARALSADGCATRCRVSDVRQITGSHWRATVRAGAVVRCAEIDVNTFAFTRRSGLHGATVAACPRRG